VCVVGKARYTHAGGPGKKIARRLFSGGIFIGTRAMLAVAVGPQQVSRRPARLVVARATHPPLDQSGASAVSPRAPASTGASARSGVSGEQGTGYE